MASDQRRIRSNQTMPVRDQQVLPVVAASAAFQTQEVRDPKARGLLVGLQSFNQNLDQYLQVQDAEDKRGGYNSGLAGGDAEKAKRVGRTFAQSFQEGSGAADSIKDAKAIQASYQTDFDKDNGDIESFIKDQYNERTAGLDDGDYQAGYDRTMAEAMQALRSQHGEYQANTIIDQNRANAMERIDQIVAKEVDIMNIFGKEYDPNRLLSEVQSVAADQRIPNTERNEMIFLALNNHAQEGHPEVLEALKESRTDIVTGQKLDPMYNIPKWKQQIDNAIRVAENVQASKTIAGLRAAEKQHENNQEVAMMGVLDLALKGDKIGANKELLRLSLDRGLFTSVKDLVNLRKIVNDGMDDVAEEGEEAVEASGMKSILDGQLSQRGILNLDGISNSGKGRLLSFWNSQEAKRTKADSAPKYHTDPQFQNAEALIKHALGPKVSPWGDWDDRKIAEGAEADSANIEIHLFAQRNPNATVSDLVKKADEIVARFQQNRAVKIRDQLQRNGTPYNSARDVMAGYYAGDIDKVTYGRYLQMFSRLAPTTPPK
jgi:hypothetical protein